MPGHIGLKGVLAYKNSFNTLKFHIKLPILNQAMFIYK